MRTPRGALLPPVSAERVKRGHLYRSIRAAILQGTLGASQQLPSTRQAAQDYGVSRGLMEEVYDQLVEEGFLDRIVGRGTFISLHVGSLVSPRTIKNKDQSLPRPSRRGLSLAANAACREPQTPRPFNGGIADTTEFPWKVWCRLQARATRELGRAALSFADPRGAPELRASVASYVAQFRGMHCDPHQVIIFNSSQQALNALSVLLLDRGDAVWLEDPCYLGARAAFDLAGADIKPVPVDDDGLRVDLGIRRSANARLAYVTPSNQYPMGVALSLERRIALLDWAKRKDSWVVEDDYDGEFRYEGQPLTPLYALDSQARVLYLGTLNKVMFVSLRLAYLIVPEKLVEPLANIRTQLDGFTSPVTQRTTSLFIDEGYFASHLRRMRSIYGLKRTLLIRELSPLSELGWTWSNNPAGMHLSVKHRNGKYVREVAAAGSLDLALLSFYRVLRSSEDGLFLRFGSLANDSLKEGARSLVSQARISPQIAQISQIH